MRPFKLFLLSLCVLPACTALRPSAVATPSEITAAPAEWDGQVIRVTGILAFRSHARQLWTEGRNRDEIENCLTLVNTWPLQATLTRLDGRRVIITGVVIPDTFEDADGNGVVDFGACNRVGLLVQGVE